MADIELDDLIGSHSTGILHGTGHHRFAVDGNCGRKNLQIAVFKCHITQAEPEREHCLSRHIEIVIPPPGRFVIVDQG